MMLQGALYILAGASLFAGARRLYTDIGLRRALNDILYTGLLILLGANAALSAASLSPDTTRVTATLSLISGTLLWSLLPWLTPRLVGVHTRLTTDLLTAAWITALLGQLSFPLSVSSYWSGVAWLMLLTLFHSAVIAAWNLWPVDKSMARRNLVALSLPALAILAGLAFDALLFPFGFLLFLLLTANLSVLPTTTTVEPPALQQIPARPVNLAFAPAGAKQAATVKKALCDSVDLPPPPTSSLHSNSGSRWDNQQQESRTQKISGLDDKERATLIALADELMDISVYASMALKRIHNNKTDPTTLQPLLRRIHSRAIKSHRDANLLSCPNDGDVNGKQERPD